jgi:hypothetical protein
MGGKSRPSKFTEAVRLSSLGVLLSFLNRY